MKKTIQDGLIILLGNFILAFSVSVFILPYDILSGGVAGIAIALKPIFHLPEVWVINALVYGMFLIGLVFLGKDFALKTALSSIVYPIFISAMSGWPLTLELSPILAALYGGLIAGFGIGLVLRVGASTGGMDIPPLILNKLTGIETSKFILIIDGMTVLLGLFSFGLEAVLVGMISVVATSWMIDKTLTFGGASAKAIQIISDHWEELNQRLNKDLDRGTTLISTQGGYTREARQMILIVIEKREYPKLMEIVNEIDPKAFMITTETQDVHGEGFKLEFRV